jgi:hypothetical protein
MSPADLRRQSPAAKGFVAAALAALSAVLLSAFFLFATVPHAAAVPDLTVAMDRSLTLVGDSAALTVSGDAIAALSPDATVEVSISGPAALSQITQADPALPRAGGFTVAVGSLPNVARLSESQLHLPVPVASLPPWPGAYRMVVTVRSSGVLMATGGTWMGRIPTRTSPLDLAFVWRAALGIHRDSTGGFIDQTLEQACTPAASGSAQGSAGAAPSGAGSLPALAGLSSRFPDWRFSLGIEPVLLTQLRDMADGYTRADGSPAGGQIGADDPAAKNAKAVLSSLVTLAEGNSVEVAAGSYADADLGLLATLGWRDGFEQIQLGKQELAQTLALGLPPAGAFSPGLDLTSGSLGDYGQASIDHVLADGSVASYLNEPIAKGTVAVRAHDDANDRVTLVLADSDLRALMTSPWDPGVLFAGIAAVLASSDRDALVLTPDPEFALPPQSYLDTIGEELKNDPWIRTQTMSDLLRSHPPDTRPVLLTRDAVLPAGYLGQTIFSAIQSAHASVDDLAAGADPVNLSLETARRSLYVAESRWWSRPGASPDEASAGLAYAVQAQTVSQGVLGKVTFASARGALILGHDGNVTLTAKNGGDSVITAELHLTGDGLRFPQGNVVKVRLEPGGNDIKVPVVGTSSSRKLAARLVVGKTVLGEESASVRFITVVDVLPWAAVAVVVIVAVAAAIVFARRRRRRRRR